MSNLHMPHGSTWSRRKPVRTAGYAAVAASATLLASRARSQPRQLTFAWSQAGNGLDVELLNWAGAADQLLEAVATDAGNDVKSFKGKVIGVAELNSPARQFHAIHPAKRGLGIDKDVA